MHEDIQPLLALIGLDQGMPSNFLKEWTLPGDPEKVPIFDNS